MKLTNIFISGLVLLLSTLCFTLNFAQAQVDPDERFSSSVYMSLKLGANTNLLVHETTNRFSPSVLSKGGSGLNVGPNVRVSDPFDPTQPGGDLLGRSETTITSDPSGQNLVVGWNDARGFLFAPFSGLPALGLSGFAFSGDGGQTWTDGGAPFVFGNPGIVTLGDPWLDTGGPGQKTYYYANLAVTADGSAGGISVHRGSFTGNNFAFDHAVFIPAPAPGDFLDKESLCAGKNNQTKNMVVVATTNFTAAGDNGAIEAFVSNDRAATFTRTIVQPAEGAPLNQGADCVISHDGKIYVVWERGRLSPFNGQFGVADPEIFIARSDDGGASFTPRILVSAISSGSLFPPGGYNRQTHNDFPRLAVANAGPFKGRVYVVYNDSRIANGGVQTPPTSSVGPEDILIGVDGGHWDLDVYLRFSDDMGATWSAPTLVAGGGGDGKIQFWPVVSTDANGRVNVTYNESVETTIPDFLDVDGLGTSLVDVFYTDSQDGGASFSTPLLVTEVPTDWGATPTNISPNFGDYIDHDSKSNRVMVTWADGRSVVQPEVFYATIGVGKLKKEGNQLAGSLPETFALDQNYPNPFNPETNITFTLPEDSRVTLKIYDMLGRELAILAAGDLAAGQHRITFDASDLPSGVYIYTVTAGNFVDSKKMILLK